MIGQYARPRRRNSATEILRQVCCRSLSHQTMRASKGPVERTIEIVGPRPRSPSDNRHECRELMLYEWFAHIRHTRGHIEAGRTAVRSNTNANLVRPLPTQNHKKGLADDPEVLAQRPARYVIKVKLDHALGTDLAASADLPRAGQSRHYLEAAKIGFGIRCQKTIAITELKGTRAHQAHLTQ